MKKVAKVIIPLILILFLVWNIGKGWEEVSRYLVNIQVKYLAVSFLLLLCVYPLNAITWHILLKKLSTKRSLRKNFYIWMISNSSRYIPGVIWQYVGRIELGKKEANISREISLAAILLETILILAAAALFSLIAISLVTDDLSKFWWFFSIPIVLLIFHAKILSTIITFFVNITKKNIKHVNLHLSLPSVLLLTVLYLINYFLIGLSIMLISVAMRAINLQLDLIFVFPAIYSLSWILGFVTLISPGGVGITEATLSILLANFMPLSVSSAVALIFRLLMVIAELLIFILAVKLKR